MQIDTVLAPNPGPFTGPGTNTYVLRSRDQVLIVDPGPVIDEHERALVQAVGDDEVVGVIVTHTHPDHAPLANPLAVRFGVPAIGWEPGPEFEPDRRLFDGDSVAVGSEQVGVVFTPGHAGDHVCLQWDRTLFSGDHIMGGSTVVVDDMAAYLDSLRKVGALELDRILPGHGSAIDDPHALIDEYISHRLEREEQILEAVVSGARSVGAVVADVYRDVDPQLHPIAAWSVAAHLEKLATEGRVTFLRPAMEDTWDAAVAPESRIDPDST